MPPDIMRRDVREWIEREFQYLIKQLHCGLINVVIIEFKLLLFLGRYV